MPTAFNTIIRMAGTAYKKNWLPGLILQTCGLFIILGYYFVPSFNNTLQKLAVLKDNGGYFFSGIVTALFAGFIPFLIQMFLEKEKLQRHHLKKGIYISLFWAYRGIEVDLLYRLQALWFGNELSFPVIVKKTIIDQFIYAPFWAIWIVTLGIMFKDHDLSFDKTRKQIDKTFLTLTYPSIVFSTWLIWVPAVAIIYSLPQLLQVPMMNIVACFYAILVMYMTRHRKELQQ